MKGLLAFANPERGRYAVLTQAGDYTIFALQAEWEPEQGVRVRCALDAPGSQTFVIDGLGNAEVVVENCHCSRAQAASWVSGN